MEETNILQPLLEILEEYDIDPWLFAGGVGVFLLLLIILIFRRKPRNTFPGLAVNLFQIAPLGRDAFLKIQNPAEAVVLSQYKILGRNDILIKNHLPGHRIETNKEYSILLEASGDQRLNNQFSLVLTYMDDAGKVYQQRILPGEQRAEKPKRL